MEWRVKVIRRKTTARSTVATTKSSAACNINQMPVLMKMRKQPERKGFI
jgi:hypothetical protein